MSNKAKKTNIVNIRVTSEEKLILLFSCSELPPRIKKAQPNLKKKKLNKQKPVKTQKVETGEKTKELLTIA